METDKLRERFGEFADLRHLTPSLDGSHDKLGDGLTPSGSAVSKAEEILTNRSVSRFNDLRELTQQLWKARVRMLVPLGKLIDEASGHRQEYLETAKNDIVTLESLVNRLTIATGDDSELRWLQGYRSFEERGSHEVVAVVLFDKVITYPEIERDPRVKAETAHMLTVEYAKSVGFMNPEEDIYHRFSSWKPEPGTKLTPRIAHSSWDFHMSFVLKDSNPSLTGRPFLTQGVSIVRERI
jgi:hypothetical protein